MENYFVSNFEYLSIDLKIASLTFRATKFYSKKEDEYVQVEINYYNENLSDYDPNSDFSFFQVGLSKWDEDKLVETYYFNHAPTLHEALNRLNKMFENETLKTPKEVDVRNIISRLDDINSELDEADPNSISIRDTKELKAYISDLDETINRLRNKVEALIKRDLML